MPIDGCMPWFALFLLLAQDSAVSSPDLTLHYPAAQLSTTMAREMLDALDEEYARIRHELSCVLGAKVTAILIPYDTWRASGHSPWAGAAFDGRILVPLIYESNRVSPQMRKVFAHEMTHACIARFGNFPTWLHEGLAQHLSGDRLSEDQRRMLRRGLAEGKLPALEKMSGSWMGLDSAQAATAYAYSLWAAELLVQYEGMEAIRQVLRYPDRLAQFTSRANDSLRR